MRIIQSARWIFLATMLFILLGCVSHLRPSSETVLIRDGAPERDIDVSGLADAIPRHELIRTAGNKTPYTVLGQTYHVNFDTRGVVQTGYASWYGKKFHGNKTSNGEVYDMYAMTAAHKNLAIPSYVRVTNLENGRTAVVRVNDRGPFHQGRIIDLSYAAAKKLGFHHKGTTKVQIEVIEARSVAGAMSASVPVTSTVAGAVGKGSNDLAASPQTYLQVGAFTKQESAAGLRQRLAGLIGHPVQVRIDGVTNLFKVLVGPIANPIELNSLRQKLADAQFPNAHRVEY